MNMSVPLKQAVTSIATKMIITVYSHDDKELMGDLYNDFTEQRISFQNTCDMLLKMEQVYDGLCFPQRSVNERSFSPKMAKRRTGKELKEFVEQQEKEIQEQNGSAKFVVHVQFRQNATWQGTIQWLEGDKVQRFRSALEMLKLMDEALDNDPKLKKANK